MKVSVDETADIDDHDDESLTFVLLAASHLGCCQDAILMFEGCLRDVLRASKRS